MRYQPHESPESQWSLPNRAILLFLPVGSVFQRKTLRQDRFRATIATSVDLEHPPVCPAW